MAGIVRIHIKSDWNDWRVRMAHDLEPAANDIYRQLYKNIGMPLQEGVEIVDCTKDEAKSRYDWQEGIDCLLYFENKTKATLQEKFLDYHTSTVTFEEKKSSGEPGAWYYCTAQYYFVGYARLYKSLSLIGFQDWVMIDLPRLHRIDAALPLPWYRNANGRDGRRAEFRYLLFPHLPTDAVIAIHPYWESRPKFNQLNWGYQ